MQDLQNENARLHRLLDIFDCQPDFMFTCTRDGRVTYLSHRLAAHRGINANEESMHVSNLMRLESVEVLYDYMNALNGSYNHQTNDKNFLYSNQRDDIVKEVYMLEDPTTQRCLVGYMRVSRVNRKPSALVDAEIYAAGDIAASTNTILSNMKDSTRTGNRSSPSKRQKRDVDNSFISAKSLEDAAAALSALTGMASGITNSSSKADDDDESATSGVSATETTVNDMTGTFANSADIYSSRENSPRGGIAGGDSRASLSLSSSANASSNALADMGEKYCGTRRRSSVATSRASTVAGATLSSNGSADVGEDTIYTGISGTVSASSQDVGGIPPLNEEEYVVVVRPADRSMPAQPIRNPVQIGPSLSKASMVKHNSQVKIEGQLGRKRSPSGGSSSANSGDMTFENTSHSSSSSGTQGGTNSGFTSKQSSGSNSNTNSDDGVLDNSSNDD